MNILYINHYAGSSKYGMEFRPYYLSKYWVNNGHNVTIISSSYSHLRIENPNVDRSFTEELIDGINYVWIKTNTYLGNGVSRIKNVFSFLYQIHLHTNRIVKKYKPDIVIASSTYPMDTYVAQNITKKADAVLIHEVHDMWPIAPMEMMGWSYRHPAVKYIQAAENSFCRNSDCIVSILPANKNYFMQHGMDEEKFHYIPNGINLEDWENILPLPDEVSLIIEEAKKKNKFIICFFGSHTVNYNLDCLLRAKKIADNENVFLLFVGNGVYKSDLIKLAKELKLPENEYAFVSPIPKKAVPSLLNLIDASYVSHVSNNTIQFGIGMNKLFDAMMGGKPILYSVNAPNNFIQQYDCGISVGPSDELALAKGINEIASIPTDRLKQMGDNGRNAVLNHFNYPVLSEMFLKVMSSTIERKQ